MFLLNESKPSAPQMSTESRDNYDEWFPYLPDQLTRHGMRPYLAYAAYTLNIQRPLVVPLSLSVILTVLGAMAGLVICDWMVRRITVRVSPEFTLVYGTTIAFAVGSLTFFSFYEHYLLALMPRVIILVLDITRRVHFSSRGGGVGFLLVAICSIALRWRHRSYFFAAASEIARFLGSTSLLLLFVYSVTSPHFPWSAESG